MTRCKYWLCCLAVFYCCSSYKLFAQQANYNWCKGAWFSYSITPDTVKGKPVKSDLHIDTVVNNHFTGVQKFWCDEDTLVQTKLAGSGFFTNGDVHYQTEEKYRIEPPGSIWDAYANCVVDTTYFSIRNSKLILHIRAKKDQKNRIRTFAYYRDLITLPYSLRWQLQKRYGTPQLIDDLVPVINPGFVDSTITDKTLPPEISNRKNTLVKTLTVTTPDIQIILLDDAEIDGDIISLYHNNTLVLNHKTIGKEMVKYALKADSEHPHHEFILVAENLGSIPPNTALVRIRAGEMKYEFVVHSDMHENVKFVIDYINNKKIDVVTPQK